ncbi:MAG: saccharopine dehydrogenase NADP-binding domain-containing protein [Spirochaetales bacterium]|nr:saccharopine dehydrogenase NADP-binding domain-containing protein [Spirochaetales bacterium]
MKKILILGVGAQGSTVAKRMDEEPNVAEIICADYDEKAVNDLASQLNKGTPLKVDASRVENIVKAAEGVDLIVNGLPMAFGRIVLEAAIKAGTNYQDFAAADTPDVDWVEGIKTMLTETTREFEAIGKTAIISTGSAPGLICVVARDAMRYLDSCETITMMVYEGVNAKRFIPFWWSPEVAYADMSDEAYAFENGEIIPTEPFSRPLYMKFKDEDKEIRLVEHAHDEPVNMGINSKEYFKGAKNIYFKYGGYGIEFAEPLYRMGILSDKPVEIDGVEVIPRNLVLKLTPPAPKYYDEIKEILEEGLESDTGAMVVRATGFKEGKKIQIESYVSAPGCAEAFEKSGLTGETYLTGQGGSLYTKMFVNDKITKTGLISSDMLDYDQVDYYLSEAAKLDITVETTVTEI